MSLLFPINNVIDQSERAAMSRFAPTGCKEFAAMEPSATRGVCHRKSNVTSPIEKGIPSCISRIFCSPLPLRLVWPRAVTPLGSKLLVVVQSVLALRRSRAEASLRVLQSVQAQTYLPASLAQSAVSKSYPAELTTFGRDLKVKQPRSADADAGFFRVSISKGMAHV